MSQPRYPRRNELQEKPARSPRRELVGLSLLAAVALAPKCGAMPYTSYDAQPYRQDQFSRTDTGPDSRVVAPTDTVEQSAADLYAPDVVETLDDATSGETTSDDLATDQRPETTR